MVWTSLFNLLHGAVRAVTSLIPNPSPPDLVGMVNSLLPSSRWGLVIGWVRWTNYYVPVNEAITIIGLRLTIYVGMQLVNLTVWVLAKLHIAGGE